MRGAGANSAGVVRRDAGRGGLGWRCARVLAVGAGLCWLGAGSAARGAGTEGAASEAPPGDMPYVSRTLLDRGLVSHAVLLHRLDGGMVVYTDERGLMRREPASEFLAILPAAGMEDVPEFSDAIGKPAQGDAGGGADTGDWMMLALVDGQRFVGQVEEPDGAGEGAVVLASRLARLVVPLEHVSWLSRSGRAPAGVDGATTDALGLANGDVLEGFIVSLGGVSAIESGPSVVEVPLERVAWARVANPREPAGQTLLWLDDGTVVCVELLAQARSDAIEVRLVPVGGLEASLSDPLGPRASIPLAEVVAASLDGGGLVALADLDVREVESSLPWTPGIEIGDRFGVPLGVADVTLPAPMSVAWSLPAGAGRLAFEAVLPEDRRVWGNAEVVVVLEQDGSRRELARQTISVERTSVAVNVVLPPAADRRRERRVRIVLEEGEGGPAQDRVVLRRPMVLVDGR